MARTIILGLAMAAALGAAYVSYDTATKLKDEKAAHEATRSDLSSTKKKLAETEKELKTTQGELDTTKITLADAEAARDKARSEAQDAKSAEAAAKSQLASVQKEAEEAVKALEDLKIQLGPMTPKQLIAEVTDLKAVKEQLTGELGSTKDQLASANSQIERYRSEEDARRRGTPPPGIHAKIVAANGQWNFVVLNVGKEQGVVENSEMIVVRDNEPIARLRVAQVEGGTCVADLTRVLRDSELPAVGDTVISTTN